MKYFLWVGHYFITIDGKAFSLKYSHPVMSRIFSYCRALLYVPPLDMDDALNVLQPSSSFHEKIFFFFFFSFFLLKFYTHL
jgi:hypothetical protein